jgi:hypothetical protein
VVPDESEMIEIVEQIEARAEQAGWNIGGPMLYMTIGSDDRNHLITTPTTAQPAMFNMPMGEAIRVIADGFETREMQRTLTEMDPVAQDAMAGVLLVHEAWMVTADAAARRPVGSLRDVPGRVEIRQAMAVDCGGRITVTTRPRGKEPTTIVTRAGGELQAAGRVTEAMVRMVKAMTRGAPPDSVDRPALNAILREIRGLNAR